MVFRSQYLFCILLSDCLYRFCSSGQDFLSPVLSVQKLFFECSSYSLYKSLSEYDSFSLRLSYNTCMTMALIPDLSFLGTAQDKEDGTGLLYALASAESPGLFIALSLYPYIMYKSICSELCFSHNIQCRYGSSQLSQ